MKEHTAKELTGHRIRIENFSDKLLVPIGHRIQITDLDTDELIQNVTAIDLHIVPRELVTARLVLLHISKEAPPDGSLHVFAHEEALTVHNPEVDLTAYVEE